MYAIPIIIEAAEICQYLIQIDNAKQSVLNGKTVDIRHPNLVYTERKSLEWLYDNLPNSTSLTSMGNYVIALCGTRAFNKALGIIGTTGGMVITPTGASAVPLARPTNITVSAGEAGVQTITVDGLAGGNGLVQMLLNDTGFTNGVNFTVNYVTGVIDFSLSSYTLQENDTLSFTYYK